MSSALAESTQDVRPVLRVVRLGAGVGIDEPFVQSTIDEHSELARGGGRGTAMHTTPRLLDVVALLSDVPAHGLLRGQVGTVVELLDGAYEVEFSDDEGRTYAELALAPDQLLVLHHRPRQAA